MSQMIEKAKELGMLIKESDELKEYKEAEAAQLDDKEAVELMMEYHNTQEELSKEAADPNITKEKYEELNVKAQAAFGKIIKNPSIARYIQAQQNFSNLMNQVNTILSYYITGEEESGCGGNCSGCSSCSGCH